MATCLKFGVYVSLIVFIGSCTYAVWVIAQDSKRITEDVHSASQDIHSNTVEVNVVLHKFGTLADNANSTVSSLQKTVQIMDGTLLAVNRPCVPGPCGLLSDSAKTLNTVRGTFGQIEIAARHENKNLTTLDAQEAQLFSDTHQVLSGIADDEQAARKSIKDLDDLLISPDFLETIHNSKDISGSLAHMLQTGDAVETKAAQPYLHPSKNPFLRTWKEIHPFVVAGAKIAATVF